MRIAEFHRSYAIVLGVVTLVVLAGCMSTTVEVSVGDDGSIERMDRQLEMAPFVFDRVEEAVIDAGYDSVEEAMRAGISEDAWDRIEYREVRTDESVTVELTTYGGDPARVPAIDVEVNESAVTFVNDRGFTEEELEGEYDELHAETAGDDPDVEFVVNTPFPEEDSLIDHYVRVDGEYIVRMPGAVSETNGDVLDDGTSVRWTTDDHENITAFIVTSEHGQPGSGRGIALAIGVIGLVGGIVTLRLVRRR